MSDMTAGMTMFFDVYETSAIGCTAGHVVYSINFTNVSPVMWAPGLHYVSDDNQASGQNADPLYHPVNTFSALFSGNFSTVRPSVRPETSAISTPQKSSDQAPDYLSPYCRRVLFFFVSSASASCQTTNTYAGTPRLSPRPERWPCQRLRIQPTSFRMTVLCPPISSGLGRATHTSPRLSARPPARTRPPACAPTRPRPLVCRLP